MTGEDIYSPTAIRRERNGGFRTMSESTHSRTKAEDSLYGILSRLARSTPYPGFWFKAQEPLHIPNCFDGSNRPVSCLPDAQVFGTMYGSGVLRVQGGAHLTHKHQLKDPIEKQRLEGMGYWVEDLSNYEAKDPDCVVAALEKHRRISDL